MPQEHAACMLYRVSLSQQHCVTAWRQSVIQQLTVPLLLSAVRALGVIEYIHPSFHDEKYLWPVSLHAVRASHASLQCGKWSDDFAPATALSRCASCKHIYSCTGGVHGRACDSDAGVTPQAGGPPVRGAGSARRQRSSLQVSDVAAEPCKTVQVLQLSSIRVGPSESTPPA